MGNMNKDGGYRAVIDVIVHTKDGPSRCFFYIGPFNGSAQAKRAVTVARKTRGKDFVDGWIEKANWDIVE